MNSTMNRESTAPDSAEGRGFGWLLVVASVLATGFAFVHPQLNSRELPEVIRQLAAGAMFNGWVHGVLIALSLCLVAGFVGVARRLGMQQPSVVLGLVFYAAGAWAMISAAVINGLSLGVFASRYPQVDPEQVVALASSLSIATSISMVWAGVGAVASSAAILAWSTNLVARTGALRIIGGFGLVLGAATIVMLVSGMLVLDVHGFLAVVVSQAVWTIAIGVALIRNRL